MFSVQSPYNNSQLLVMCFEKFDFKNHRIIFNVVLVFAENEAREFSFLVIFSIFCRDFHFIFLISPIYSLRGGGQKCLFVFTSGLMTTLTRFQPILSHKEMLLHCAKILSSRLPSVLVKNTLFRNTWAEFMDRIGRQSGLMSNNFCFCWSELAKKWALRVPHTHSKKSTRTWEILLR